MSVVLKTYDVYYIGHKGKEGVYRSTCALCPDGAEEAARLDVKGLREIKKVVEIV